MDMLYLAGDERRYRHGTDERNGQEKQRLWISMKHREPQTLIPKKNYLNITHREILEKTKVALSLSGGPLYDCCGGDTRSEGAQHG